MAFNDERRRRLWLVAIGLAFGLCIAITPTAVGAGPTTDTRQAAAALAAERIGVPSAQLRVIASTSLSFTTTRAYAEAYKFLDRRSGAIVDVAVDALGHAVRPERLLRAERAAWVSRHGHLEPAVVDRLAAVPLTASMRVSIWVKTPRYAGPEIASVDASTAADPEVVKASAAQAEAAERYSVRAARRATAPLVDRLRGMGLAPEWDGQSPLIHVVLPAVIVPKVGRWPEVSSVYLTGRAASLGDVYSVVRPTVGADVVQARGYTGANVKLAMDEVGGAIAVANPYLRSVVIDPLANLCYPSAPAFGGHATAVAGMIHFIATGASILATGSCGGNIGALQDRALGALNWGAAVVNHSWGEAPKGGADNLLDASDLYFDWLESTKARLQVFAAGNDGTSTGNVGSPGSAYNVLTVGNYNDNGTWDNWADDTMWGTSSYLDPVSSHSDRQKPEVSAPGANDISTTLASPWWGSVGSGTSYAAPVVTGIAGQIIQRAPAIVSYPTAIKAILMATAIHNIEGATRLSGKDGAGGVWAPYADDIAHGVNGTFAAYNWNCSAAVETNLTTIPVVAGKRTRVVIAWNTDTGYTYYKNQPSSDYDLSILNGTTVVASSGSYDNTYEIVDFTPSASGNYTLRVHQDRCNVSPRQLSYAWWRNP